MEYIFSWGWDMVFRAVCSCAMCFAVGLAFLVYRNTNAILVDRIVVSMLDKSFTDALFNVKYANRLNTQNNQQPETHMHNCRIVSSVFYRMLFFNKNGSLDIKTTRALFLESDIRLLLDVIVPCLYADDPDSPSVKELVTFWEKVARRR